MRSKHLFAVLAGVAAVAILAADVSAMYHPALGRFMQRDPEPGGPVAPRTGQYHDGMNLHQYARSAPTVYVDNMGAASKNLGEAMQGYRPRPAAPWPEAAPLAQARTGGYGLRVPDPALRAALQKTMNDMCPCFNYQDQGNGRIAITDKFPASDSGGSPSRDFCCCYYQHLPGCNLLMKYRDEGGRSPMPTGQDFIAVPGRAWMADNTRMGVRPNVTTLAHEMLHGMFGNFNQPATTATWRYEHAVDAGTALITGAEFDGGRQPADVKNAAATMVKELGKDRAGCENRPEFRSSPEQATAETDAALERFRQFQNRANTIADSFE